MTAQTKDPPAPRSDFPETDAVGDQRLLATVKAAGGQIYDIDLLLWNAHEVCRLFRKGMSIDQVNAQMAARTGDTMNNVEQLTAIASQSYENCP